MIKRSDGTGDSYTTDETGFVLGPLSLHEETNKLFLGFNYPWRVTHLASGKCLLYFNTKTKAKKALHDLLNLKIDWYSSAEQLMTHWNKKASFKKRMREIAEGAK